MTNGFGAMVEVKETICIGGYLRANPRTLKIPLDINIAKNYEIENLVVDLYIKLKEINQKDTNSEATYSFPYETIDMRTIYEVEILGYKLRDKKTNKIITSGSI